MKVYLVTEGSYSEYHIIGAFSTRELAEQCAASLNDGNYHEPSVEEFDLDPLADHWRQGLRPYQVGLVAETGEADEEDPVRVATYWCLGGRFGVEKVTRSHSHRGCPVEVMADGTRRHDYNSCLFRRNHGELLSTPYDQWVEEMRQYIYEVYEVEVWARDEAHALKAAHDRWAQWKATGVLHAVAD